MVRTQPPGNEPKRNSLVGRFLDFAGTKYAGGIPVKQQPQQDFWGDRFPTLVGVAAVNRTQIELANDVDHKARQMVGWQHFAQTDLQVQRLFIIGGLKFSWHARSLPFYTLPVDPLRQAARCA